MLSLIFIMHTKSNIIYIYIQDIKEQPTHKASAVGVLDVLNLTEQADKLFPQLERPPGCNK